MNKSYVEWLEKHYGMKCMGLEEELALSESERSTRNCKNEIIDKCKWMKEYVEYIEEYARKIPVEDDERHAEMVRGLRKRVANSEMALQIAVLYDGRDVV